MKRNYRDTLRSSSAMNDPATGSSSAQDARLARTEALLREAQRDRIAEAEQTRTKRERILLDAAREEVRKQGKAHSIHQAFVRTDDDGELKVEIAVFQEASADIVRLMENPQPLMTGLTWQGMPTQDRAAMLKRLDLDSDLVFADSVRDVLPKASQQYALDWQQQINCGGAWSGSLSVGQRAEAMIELGYLLYGKDASAGELHDVPSRMCVEGRPGSASFVKAIMGADYLAWLVANEKHPIEA